MDQPQWHFDLFTNPGRGMPPLEEELLYQLEVTIENNPDRVVHECTHCQTYEEAYSLAEKIGYEYHNIHWTTKAEKDKECFYVMGVRLDSLTTQDHRKAPDELLFEYLKADLAGAKKWKSEITTMKTATAVIDHIKNQSPGVWAQIHLMDLLQGNFAVFALRAEKE